MKLKAFDQSKVLITEILKRSLSIIEQEAGQKDGNLDKFLRSVLIKTYTLTLLGDLYEQENLLEHAHNTYKNTKSFL